LPASAITTESVCGTAGAWLRFARAWTKPPLVRAVHGLAARRQQRGPFLAARRSAARDPRRRGDLLGARKRERAARAERPAADMTASIVVEWDNARLVAESRPMRMLSALAAELAGVSDVIEVLLVHGGSEQGAEAAAPV